MGEAGGSTTRPRGDVETSWSAEGRRGEPTRLLIAGNLPRFGGWHLFLGADGTVRRFDPRADVEAALFREVAAPTDFVYQLVEVPAAAGASSSLLVLGAPGRPFEVDVVSGSARAVAAAPVGRVGSMVVDRRSRRLALSLHDDRPIEVVPLAAAGSAATGSVRLPDGVPATDAILSQKKVTATKSGQVFTSLRDQATGGAKSLREQADLGTTGPDGEAGWCDESSPTCAAGEPTVP